MSSDAPNGKGGHFVGIQRVYYADAATCSHVTRVLDAAMVRMQGVHSNLSVKVVRVAAFKTGVKVEMFIMPAPTVWNTVKAWFY